MLVSQFQPIIAAGDFGDWLEILFLILVFGGSALGAMMKKIIAHFSPDEQGSTPAKPTVRRRTPKMPVARPMSVPRPDARMESSSPTQAKGEFLAPLRPVAGYPKPEKPARPARPVPSSIKPPAPKPSPSLNVPMSAPSSRRRSLEKPSRSTSPKASAHPKKAQAMIEHEHGVLVDLHESGEALVEDSTVPIKKLSPRQRLLGSRASVRQAIILSEILAPPLAMRDSSDT